MRKEQNFRFDRLTMGVCYYPEHWDRSLWEEDLDRMQAAGIRVVRCAEFAWSLMEPEEGHYDFSLFDAFLALCESKDMKVILGTPTATPPSWLTRKYPEALNAREDGTVYQHGGRRHYNYNSPVYQKKCRQIVTKMAQHFGQHPAVIGWQIDNEINCETDEFYSHADEKAFRLFLRERYHNSLDALNEAWGTVFWSQTYTDWEEIPLPGRVINHAVNPHHHLDYLRFVSASAIRFASLQAEILRQYKKEKDFITTNGMFGSLDNHRLTDSCLDIYSYDSYPNFAFGLNREEYFRKRRGGFKNGDLDDRRWSKHLTEVRSICPHFAILEQQSGAGSWTTRMEGPSPKPGQLTLWAMQSLAHGADLISFFRWRTATVGTEIYWHGILDYDNRDNRRLTEVRRFGVMLESLQPMTGAAHCAAFGVLRDYDNLFDERVDAWHARCAKMSEQEIFAAAQLSHRPYDVVDLTDYTERAELLSYKVLFYPHPVILTERRAELLRQYVEAGGTLVIGARSGYKDIHGHCVMEPQPGLLKDITGTTVKEFSFASPADPPQEILWGGRPLTAPLFFDALEPGEDTTVLARFAHGWLRGEAALTSHRLGKGRCLHLGSVFGREITAALFEELGLTMAFDAWGEFPMEVETVLRRRSGKYYLFLLNYQPYEVTIRWKQPMRSVLDGAERSGEQVLAPYGVDVVTPLPPQQTGE